jgi:hypothetical protein
MSTTTKHTVAKFKAEDFGSYQLFLTATRRTFFQDMVILKLARYNDMDPRDLAYFQDLHGCASVCPYQPTEASQEPMLATEDDLKRYESRLSAWKTMNDLISDHKKNRAKADKNHQDEIFNATQWSMHLLGAFPEKCLVAENLKERILAQAYDPLDKEVLFDKPKLFCLL